MNKREAQEQLEEMFTKEELKYYLENFGPGIKPTQKMINSIPFEEIMKEHELIVNKQSKLTKSQRDAVVYRFNKESVKE